MEKRYLFTPGPTPVPPQVLAALAEPVLHHRGPDFREVYARCLGRLAEICRTGSEVLLYTASGTGLMESAVANLLSPGDRAWSSPPATSASAGPSSRAPTAPTWTCSSYAWGETPFRLRSRAAARRQHTAVLLTHSETSTGVVADIQSLAAVAKDAGAIVAVDAVSSLGAVPLETDAWRLDVVVSGSQKALMTPPGLAFVSVSEAAWNRRRQLAALLLRLGAHARRRSGSSTPPSRPRLAGRRRSTSRSPCCWRTGLEAGFERHVRLGRACRAGVKAMGLELFSPDDDPPPS